MKIQLVCKQAQEPLAGTKIGWGVKRAENHQQPDLRKNKCRANGKIRTEYTWEIEKRNMYI